MKPLPFIMVAPNGARLTKADHPELPITQDEIVRCAVDCFAAGARGLHAHIRDANGAHLLDSEIYRDLLLELRRFVPDMAVQITTEAAGAYEPDKQMQVALSSGAEMVSASIREINRAGAQTAREFYIEAEERGIAVQHILYNADDCLLLNEILPTAHMVDPRLQLLFVLGRYSTEGAPDPGELDPFLDWLNGRQLAPDWAVCAFGTAETACLVEAVRSGGKCRVGFENSQMLSDGSVAKSNTEKVADLVAAIVS